MVGNNNKNEKVCEDQKDPKWACPPIRNVTHPLRYYEFTQEEIKALEECDKESFYQRCIPFSAILGSLTYVAITKGILSGSKHFGAVPKVLLASCIGYIYGRVSYIPACEKKLLELPSDSHLGNVMRKYHIENNPPNGSKAH